MWKFGFCLMLYIDPGTKAFLISWNILMASRDIRRLKACLKVAKCLKSIVCSRKKLSFWLV